MSRNEVDSSSSPPPPRFGGRRSHEIERAISASTLSTASSAGRLASRATMTTRPAVISRVSTQRDLEMNPMALSRINTQRSQHTNTVGRAPTHRSRASREPLPNFGAGKPFPPALPDRDEYVVEFDGPNDPLNAQNWPLRKKSLMAAMLGYTTLVSSFGSSIFSEATLYVGHEFGVSAEVGLLGVSLYVLGFATGPTLWAPLSELRGRRLPLVMAMFGFSLFSIATATAKDLQTVLLCRFFGGFFGACPLAVVGAIFSDMFDNRTRGIAITLFSMTVFCGPFLAPFIGGFIATSDLGWRWTMYIVAMMGFVAFALDLALLQETYPPQILVAKAADLRRRTLNWGIHAKQEEVELDLRELVTRNFSRPLRLLCFEPIVTLLSIYMAFVYGLLYLFLSAYSFVFVGIYHFSTGIAGLTFFGMITGQLLAGITVLLQQPDYQRRLEANGGVPVPEWRLPVVIAGGVAFTGGVFWFGWSGYNPHVHWIVPTLSGILSGFGIMAVFLQSLNYLVDAYLMFAASAIAGNTLLRSLAGAVFPLFSSYMFEGMGIQWASTLLGCVAAALIPIPVVFYLYGHKIRAKSRFAPSFGAPGSGPGHDDDDDDENHDDDAVLPSASRAEKDGARDAAVRGSVPRTEANVVERAV